MHISLFKEKITRLIVLLLILFIGLSQYTTASNNIRHDGAQAAGMGHAVVALPEAGYFQNQALLAFFDSLYIELYSSVPYIIAEFGTHSIFAVQPILGGVISIQYQYFGYSNYNENKAGFAYARKLSDRLSAGVQLDWVRIAIPAPYNSVNKIFAELGLAYQLNHRLLFGAHIFNPTLTKFANDISESPQTAIRAGLSYYPIEQIACTFEVVQMLNKATSFRAGTNIKVTPNLNVTAGYNHDNRTLALGVGIRMNSIAINIASEYHNILGYTPHFSIGKSF